VPGVEALRLLPRSCLYSFLWLRTAREEHIQRFINMSSDKRQSVAGKVATPKVATPTQQPQELNSASSLSKAIGAR
jgi:hypothetical protein